MICKLAYVPLLLVFLCSDFLYGASAATKIQGLKRELNSEFGLGSESAISVTSVVRTPVESFASAPLISHSEFEQVFGLIAASCIDPENWWKRCFRGTLGAASVSYSRGSVSLNSAADQRIALLPKEKHKKTIESVDSTIDNIGEYILKNKLGNACKLVVFNEMFFSQLNPLSTEQKKFIEKN